MKPVRAKKDRMRYFADLGGRVESRWRKAGFDDRAFADIAGEELSRTPAHSAVGDDDILEWCNRPGFDLPAQSDIAAEFGNPPVTVYRGHAMYIDVNFWLDGTTSIHEHTFDGAFQVLGGSSVHTEYDFVEQGRHNAQAYVGQLTARGTEVLGIGETRCIAAGAGFIHALFHLEAPSSTVVVRTQNNRLAGVQRDFFMPGLAFDGFNVDPTAQRCCQVATLMCATENPRLDAWLERYFEFAGPRESYDMLLAVHDAFKGRRGMTAARHEELLAPLVARVERSSTWGPMLVQAFRIHRRTRSIIGARASVSDSDQRFFLALLANVQTAAALYRLVGERFPKDDPVAKVFGWVELLCGKGSPLGLVVNSSMLLVARGLAEGRPLAEIAAALNGTRERPATLADLRQAEAALRDSILAVLFPATPVTRLRQRAAPRLARAR
jgi:hypothetical protein